MHSAFNRQVEEENTGETHQGRFETQVEDMSMTSRKSTQAQGQKLKTEITEIQLKERKWASTSLKQRRQNQPAGDQLLWQSHGPPIKFDEQLRQISDKHLEVWSPTVKSQDCFDCFLICSASASHIHMLRIQILITAGGNNEKIIASDWLRRVSCCCTTGALEDYGNAGVTLCTITAHCNLNALISAVVMLFTLISGWIRLTWLSVHTTSLTWAFRIDWSDFVN